ncbi:E3 ubiquitin-protein ligase RNF25 [Gossypium australe]|uniref:E3 ubiquitin-protein ligase RNF25 n=1 Tax=Gossypium australe TaxID=47621 RepID=A0A5B6X1W3_9ROSI|nr:E3 ubiquitin-protein ligase RNF25 [Gossypium australe]
MAEEEEVKMEVEAVQSVYGDDCVIIESYPPYLHLHIKPCTADVSSQQFVEAAIGIQASSQEAVERLSTMNHPDGDCPLCLYPLVSEDDQTESVELRLTPSLKHKPSSFLFAPQKETPKFDLDLMEWSCRRKHGNCPVCHKVFHAKDFEHMLDLVGSHSSQLDRLTVSPEIYPSLSIVISKIYKDGGVGAFYAGLSPTLVGMLPYSTCYYFMYEKLKKSYCQSKKKKSLNCPDILVVGALAECLGALGGLGSSLSPGKILVFGHLRREDYWKQDLRGIVCALLTQGSLWWSGVGVTCEAREVRFESHMQHIGVLFCDQGGEEVELE